MNKYQKIQVIGEGNFGSVSLCKNIETNEVYAIKEINIKGLSEEDVKKMTSEAELQMQINSFYVIKCYNFFVENSSLYLVLQFCSQGTLRDFLEKVKSNASLLSEEFIMELFLKFCLGVAAFHTKNIIHRDLKPENIFMLSKKNPKIGDLGLSKSISSKKYATTVVGTVCYLSPEILNNKPYNEKSDIWALGCILYELCTFQVPFSSIKSELTEDPKRIPSSYSEGLKDLMHELLEKDYNKRPDLFQIFNKPYVKRKLIELNLFSEAKSFYSKLEIIEEKDPIEQFKDFIENLKSRLEIVKTIKKKKVVASLCFLKDGRLVSGAGGKDYSTIEIYNKESEKLNTYQPDIIINSDAVFVCGLKNGDLASANGEGFIYIFEIKGNQYKNIHTLIENSLEKGGSTSNKFGNTRRFGVGKIEKLIELEDGKLCSCSFFCLFIWDSSNNYQCVKKITNNFGFWSIAEVDNYIASIPFPNLENNDISLYDKSTYECTKTIKGIKCACSFSFSKLKEHKLILAEGNNRIAIVDILSSDIKHFEDDRLGDAFSIHVLKSVGVLIGSYDGDLIYFIDLVGKVIFAKKVNMFPITCIVESEDGRIYSSSGDGTINVYK